MRPVCAGPVERAVLLCTLPESACAVRNIGAIVFTRTVENDEAQTYLPIDSPALAVFAADARVARIGSPLDRVPVLQTAVELDRSVEAGRPPDEPATAGTRSGGADAQSCSTTVSSELLTFNPSV